MEKFTTEINVDELFNTWEKNWKICKRKILMSEFICKDELSMNDVFYFYDGEPICDHPFSYSFPGNRCEMCNSLSFLEDHSDLNEDILIKHGEYTGKKLTIKQYPLDGNKCAFYRRIDKINPSIFDNFSPCSGFQISNFKRSKNMVSIYGGPLHYAIVSSYLNSLEIKTTFECAYVCNTVKIIKHKPNFRGSFKDVKLTPDYIIKIIKSICEPFCGANLVHSDLCLDYFSYDIEDSEIVCYFDPDEKSSFSSDGYFAENGTSDQPIYISIRSNYSSFDNVGKDFIVSGSTYVSNPLFSDLAEEDIPCVPKLSSEKYCYVEYIPITIELINFVLKTGISVFPPLQAYMMLIACMCDENFHHNVSNSILELFFFSDDLPRVYDETKKMFNKQINSQKLKEFCCDIGFKMRSDVSTLYQVLDELE